MLKSPLAYLISQSLQNISVTEFSLNQLNLDIQEAVYILWFFFTAYLQQMGFLGVFLEKNG